MASAPLSFMATSPAPRPGAGLGPLSLPHLSTDETTESVTAGGTDSRDTGHLSGEG